MGAQFYVYEIREDGEERGRPRRISWRGWQPLSEWLHEESLDADGQMVRQFEFRQAAQVAEETAGLELAADSALVSPLPDLRGPTVMFGAASEDTDYVVSPVPLQWLLPQASNGWEVAMTYTVERVGGRGTEGYFSDDS
ncbi:MAG: hypothetical protein GX131_05540 [candidate division WS1 bacterium]|nr:hypothetical protein [candidate division WS1 bacterium]